MEITMAIRVGVAHGAIRNAGDYLIYKRGLRLLKRFLGNTVELVEIKRWIHLMIKIYI